MSTGTYMYMYCCPRVVICDLACRGTKRSPWKLVVSLFAPAQTTQRSAVHGGHTVHSRRVTTTSNEDSHRMAALPVLQLSAQPPTKLIYRHQHLSETEVSRLASGQTN